MSWSHLKKGRVSIQSGEYFITFNCHNRKALFSDHNLAKVFCRCIEINELLHQCCWLTWVLMPDHFHGLLRLSDSSLGKTVGHLKGLSAREINKIRCFSQTVWQPAYYDHALREEESRIAVARYIAANPLRKKLVDNLGSYPYRNSVFL